VSVIPFSQLSIDFHAFILKYLICTDNFRTLATMKATSSSRFDTRLPKSQKELFEYAATIGGFRNLTEFVISSTEKIAREIIEKHNAILASKKDQEIFFKALMQPQKPNARLKKAAARFKAEVKK
jgi:uncharacterized protein (DUF1778 family)